jgi:hypothetical protein
MAIKLRLIFRKGVTDFEGKLAEYQYKSDLIELSDNANAFQFQNTKDAGWLPELIGGEWIIEKD